MSTERPRPARRLRTWGPPVEPVPYQRYVGIQESLRAARREVLLFCEHPPTLTAGIQSRTESLLLSAAQLQASGIEHVRIGRGGDYTAHEPGQLVIYAHVDLNRRGLAVGDFFAMLLDVTAESIRKVWGLSTNSRHGAPGLYVEEGGKVASIGIMFKRFFTSFGVAVNISNELATFRAIHACGDPNVRVTSIAACGADIALRPLFEKTWESLFRERLEAAR